MTKEQWTRETLGEDVGYIFVRGEPFGFEGTFLDVTANEVIAKVNVLGANVVGCFLG